MQNMAWYARYDMKCICVLRKRKNDQGINLANQVCQWKDEMISIEIDIKITGFGCTVCKWQAKQKWHQSAINSMMPSRMQRETKLLHSNITKRHMAVMYTRCLTKHEQWATAKSHQNRFKQAWQKCQRYQVSDLVKLTACQEFNMRKQCLEHDNNMLQEHIIAKKGMARSYSKHTTKLPYWP